MIAMPPLCPKRGASLARLSAIFGAVFLISVGVCGYSIHTGDEFGGTPGFVSFLGMILSVVSLVVIGITALIRMSK